MCAECASIIEPILLENPPTYSSFSLCAGVKADFHDHRKIRSDELWVRKLGVDLVIGKCRSGRVRQYSDFFGHAKDGLRQPHSRHFSGWGCSRSPSSGSFQGVLGAIQSRPVVASLAE